MYDHVVLSEYAVTIYLETHGDLPKLRSHNFITFSAIIVLPMQLLNDRIHK